MPCIFMRFRALRRDLIIPPCVLFFIGSILVEFLSNFVDHHLVVMALAGVVPELSCLIRVNGVPWFVDCNKNIFFLIKRDMDRVLLGKTLEFICFVDCCFAAASGVVNFSLVERLPWRLPRMCPFWVSSESGKVLLTFFAFKRGHDW